jgi:Virulence factor
MAELILLSWRDIPAQIIVRDGRRAEKRELPEMFIQAIDRAAMTVGAKDSDAYLSAWARSKPQQVSDDLADEADREVARILAAYSRARLTALAHAGGTDTEKADAT